MARRTETEILSAWTKNNLTPMVTVIAICYCHEKYLHTALDSVLAQETSFPFEVLVHDDASPDGSAAIILEYAKAYPHIIRPILEQENQYSKGSQAIFRAIKPGIRGKYLAYLDCDDYWTDVHKLQEQVDFLEAHPAYLAVAHNCTVVDQDGEATGEQYPECRDAEYTIDHFLHDTLAGQFATLVVRDIFTQAANDHHLIMTAPRGPFDRVFNLTLLLNGRVYCIQKSMSAYRHITSGGESFSATYRFDIQRETRFYLSLALYCKKMGRTGDAIGMQRWLVGFLEQFVNRQLIGEKEAAPYLAMCMTSIASLSDRLRNRYKRCACCGQYVLYEPLPIERQEAALSVDRLFLPETLNPDDYLCPACGSMDRERLMAAALERMGLRQKGRDYHILQIAPSPALDRWLRVSLPGAACETCELNMAEPDFHADFQALSAIPDGRYDLILCSHVLERVRDDRQALRELKRILNEDGCILLLVPVDLSFSGVDEAWGLGEAENYHRFGQGDHVRRYSREGLLERLAEQFSVQLFGKDFFGADCFWHAGLSDSSTLYVLSKPGHHASFTEAQLPETACSAARLVIYIREPGDAQYTEEKTIRAQLPLQSRYSCTLPLSAYEEITHIRIDPMERPCFLRSITASLITADGERIPVPILGTNGLAFSDGLLFNNDDPQIELTVPQGNYREVSFSCELLCCERRGIEYMCGIAAEWSRLAAKRERLSGELARTAKALTHSEADAEKLSIQLTSARRNYDIISNAAFSMLSKPARIILGTLKKFLHICEERFRALRATRSSASSEQNQAEGNRDHDGDKQRQK